MSTEERRYQSVHADVQRLLQQASTDRSPAGILGLGSVWLAAELFARNEERRLESQTEQQGKTEKE